MKQSLNIGKEPDFQKIIITSAVMHLLLITLVAFPVKTNEREFKTYFVNLVAPAEIRGDTRVPALKKPVKNKTGKRAIKTKPNLKRRVKPKSKADMSLEPANRVAKEIERLSAISAISKKKRQKEEQTAEAGESDNAIARAIEGIRKKKLISISRGLGIPSRVSSADAESYYALITEEIWSEWIPPDYTATGLEAIISIKINSDGKVVSREIEKSSGNTFFDRSASKAISKASPLPPPPVEMEIGVRFYL